MLTTSNEIKKIMTIRDGGIGTEGQVPCPSPQGCTSAWGTHQLIHSDALPRNWISKLSNYELEYRISLLRERDEGPVAMSLVKRKFPVYFINNLFFFDCFMYNEIKIFIQ